jgi:hypothetical protein
VLIAWVGVEYDRTGPAPQDASPAQRPLDQAAGLDSVQSITRREQASLTAHIHPALIRAQVRDVRDPYRVQGAGIRAMPLMNLAVKSDEVRLNLSLF